MGGLRFHHADRWTDETQIDLAVTVFADDVGGLDFQLDGAVCVLNLDGPAQLLRRDVSALAAQNHLLGRVFQSDVCVGSLQLRDTGNPAGDDLSAIAVDRQLSGNVVDLRRAVLILDCQITHHIGGLDRAVPILDFQITCHAGGLDRVVVIPQLPAGNSLCNQLTIRCFCIDLASNVAKQQLAESAPGTSTAVDGADFRFPMAVFQVDFHRGGHGQGQIRFHAPELGHRGIG